MHQKHPPANVAVSPTSPPNTEAIPVVIMIRSPPDAIFLIIVHPMVNTDTVSGVLCSKAAAPGRQTVNILVGKKRGRIMIPGPPSLPIGGRIRIKNYIHSSSRRVLTYLCRCVVKMQ